MHSSLLAAHRSQFSAVAGKLQPPAGRCPTPACAQPRNSQLLAVMPAASQHAMRPAAQLAAPSRHASRVPACHAPSRATRSSLPSCQPRPGMPCAQPRNSQLPAVMPAASQHATVRPAGSVFPTLLLTQVPAAAAPAAPVPAAPAPVPAAPAAAPPAAEQVDVRAAACYCWNRTAAAAATLSCCYQAACLCRRCHCAEVTSLHTQNGFANGATLGQQQLPNPFMVCSSNDVTVCTAVAAAARCTNMTYPC
jgi:hypothetical protein